MSELIRLLSKDAGGSKHYTGRGGAGGVASANHGGKMFGLRRQETEPGASRAEADGRKEQKEDVLLPLAR